MDVHVEARNSGKNVKPMFNKNGGREVRII